MNYRSFVVAGTIGAAALSAACMSATSVGTPVPFSYIDVREIPESAGTGLMSYAAAIFVKDRVTGFVPSYALNEHCDDPAAITTDAGLGTSLSGANLEPGAVSMTVKGTADTTTRTAPLTVTSITSSGHRTLSTKDQ